MAFHCGHLTASSPGRPAAFRCREFRRIQRTVVPPRCRLRATGDESKVVQTAESKLDAKKADVERQLKNASDTETKEKLKESLKTIDGLKAELKAAAEATKQ